MKILVTGAAGFIGSTYVRVVLEGGGDEGFNGDVSVNDPFSIDPYTSSVDTCT